MPATVRGYATITRILLLVVLVSIGAAALPAVAQEIELRTYSNTPVGMNFLVAPR